jgi:hypothetical protein
MILFHNRLVDRLRAAGESEADLFARARQETTWHYQWIVLHDFVPRLVGREIVDDLLTNGPRFYQPDGVVTIPLEFADAAYRYGHSQIRHRYRVNSGSSAVPIFPDLIGFDAVPETRAIDWPLLFDLPGHPPAQRAKKIDGRLTRALIELPLAITGEVEVAAYHSLAVRDLQRGHGVGLPSGEAVARRMGETSLTAAEIGLGDEWQDETPFWFYVLREASVRQDGERLGPVGGRIVAEVLFGLIDNDPQSHRTLDPDWQPTAPAAQPGTFGLADLLSFAIGAT